MKKIALLFAGQGTQYIGMGQDFYHQYQYVKDFYNLANTILGYDLTKICFEENTLINQTNYTQPAILVTSLAIAKVLKNEFNLPIESATGFSLGEYTALAAADVFDDQTILSLIKERARLMSEASLKNPGSMAAIIGLEFDKIKLLCEDIGDVFIANYNTKDQVVIGGLTSSVKLFCEKAKQLGSRRAIVLNVSGAFHTPLMMEAADKMYEIIKNTYYQNPRFELFMNYSAERLIVEDLPLLMKKQISSPVQFEQTIKNMIASGINQFIEIGPGTVLSGFVKKIDPLIPVISINKIPDLELLGGLL